MRTFAISIVFSLLVSAVVQAQQESLQALEQQAFRAAAAQVAESVVQIEAIGGLEKVGEVLVGSAPTTGLIVSKDGLIVSSAFSFAQDPTSILVSLPNGQRKPARIVSRDNSRMLVLLQVESDEALPVPQAAPVDEMQVGEWAVAVGRTFSEEEVNVSVGILSAKDRVWGKAIQTDAKVSPGNYGGPLVDLQGRVMGVLVPLSTETELYDAQGKRIAVGITAGHDWYDSGIGFAVPLESIFARLERWKKADLFRGRLGISLKGSAIESPAVIAAVQVNSPAADADLKAGDRIVRANQVAIERQSHLQHVLGPLYGGDQVQLVVMRGDQRLEVEAVLVDALPTYEHPFLGILPDRQAADEVKIRWVYPGSPANEAGLKPGDKLEKFNGQPIENATELRDGLASLEPGEEIGLDFVREEESQSIKISLATLPTDIPSGLPAAVALEGDPPQAETGEIEIRIPEEANKCTAYVPSNYDARRSYGLLVSLHPAGKADAKGAIEEWKAACEANDLILLMPCAETATRWQPSEEAFIRKTIDDAMTRYSIDPTRVVIHGFQGGAAMAYLTAFKHRDLVRGVVAVDSALPLVIGQPQNDPVQRLAILTAVGKESKLYDRVTEGVKQLRELKFPVTLKETGDQPRALNEQERQDVAKWIDALDRI